MANVALIELLLGRPEAALEHGRAALAEIDALGAGGTVGHGRGHLYWAAMIALILLNRLAEAVFSPTILGYAKANALRAGYRNVDIQVGRRLQQCRDYQGRGALQASAHVRPAVTAPAHAAGNAFSSKQTLEVLTGVFGCPPTVQLPGHAPPRSSSAQAVQPASLPHA
jgi:hypothetical protein